MFFKIEKNLTTKFRHRYCRQYSEGRDSHIPLPFPSPETRSLPGLPATSCQPGKSLFSSCKRVICLIFWHLWNVVVKDVQGCELALGGSGQEHHQSEDFLRRHRVIKNDWMPKGVQDLGELHWGQGLFDPGPGDVFLPLGHPPEKTVSLRSEYQQVYILNCWDFLYIYTWWVWGACEACRNRGSGGRSWHGAGHSQWRWSRSACPSTDSWTNILQLWYRALLLTASVVPISAFQPGKVNNQ